MRLLVRLGFTSHIVEDDYLPSIFNKGERMVVIKSNFIGKFKIGDNINHNLDVLGLLYKYFDKADLEQKGLLYKPITITIVSIIEAVLYDFLWRVYKFTTEGVQGLSERVINSIRGKDYDEFCKYIECAKKHKIFGKKDCAIYDNLQELRTLRNRIHIQNRDGHLEPDELKAFNDTRKILAEKVLEEIMRTLSREHSREDSHHHVKDFELPWKAHF